MYSWGVQEESQTDGGGGRGWGGGSKKERGLEKRVSLAGF